MNEFEHPRGAWRNQRYGDPYTQIAELDTIPKKLLKEHKTVFDDDWFYRIHGKELYVLRCPLWWDFNGHKTERVSHEPSSKITEYME